MLLPNVEEENKFNSEAFACDVIVHYIIDRMTLHTGRHWLPAETLVTGGDTGYRRRHWLPAETLVTGRHWLPADTGYRRRHWLPAETLVTGGDRSPAETLSRTHFSVPMVSAIEWFYCGIKKQKIQRMG